MQNHKAVLPSSLKRVFLWPTLLGVLTALGLVVALVEDGGIFEALSMAALGVPVMTMIYIYFFRDFFKQ